MFDPVSMHLLSKVVYAERIERLRCEAERPRFALFRPALRLTGQLLVRMGTALQGTTAPQPLDVEPPAPVLKELDAPPSDVDSHAALAA